MPNNPRAAENLKPFTGADDPRRGHKPKGSKHLSTHIQEMLNDEEFEFIIMGGDDKGKKISYKGRPMKAIIAVAIHKAMKGGPDANKYMEWLAKHGYGTNINLNTADPVEEVLRRFGLLEGEQDDQQAESPKS